MELSCHTGANFAQSTLAIHEEIIFLGEDESRKRNHNFYVRMEYFYHAVLPKDHFTMRGNHRFMLLFLLSLSRHLLTLVILL